MEKVSLPTKTKIAAWLMLIFGISGSTIFLVLNFSLGATMIPTMPTKIFVSQGKILFSIYSIILGLFLIIPAFLLSGRKKLGWWLSIIILFGTLTLILILGLFPEAIIALPFFIHNVVYYYLFPFNVFLGHFIGFFSSITLIFLSFIFLLLDRKNYWKIVT